eukprot:g3611.t1
MQDASSPVFETTDAGFQVSGTGQLRLEAAARAGAAVRSRSVPLGWRRIMRRRPRSRMGNPRGSRTDPYAGEDGPGSVSQFTRLRMDLWGYGAGRTKDAYGTEADIRAISASNAHWAGFKLRVLTQNLWGLPVVSRCLEARVHAFANTLGGGWDVVALQEVWHARERDALRSAALAAGLRYSRHFEHGCGAPVLGPGMGGTGLLVLSRFPIAESFFRRFSANGQPYQLQHADYLGGKGVGLVRLHTPAGAVDLYVSHLHGDYSRARGSGTPDRYKAHRVAQAFEVAHIIRLTSRSPLVLLLSDLNAGPGSMAYGLQRSVAGLHDAFAEAKPAEAGHTCEANDNVFSNGRDPPARLDYVLFKALPPPLCAPQAVEPTWALNDCWVHRAYIPEEDADDAVLAQIRSPPPPAVGAAAAQGGSSRTRSSTTARGPTAGVSSLAGSPQQRQALPNGDGPGAAGSSLSPPLRVASPSSLSSPVRARGGSLVDGVGVVGAGGGGGGGGGDGVGGRDGARSPSRGGVARRVNVSDHHGVAAEFTARDPEAEDDDDDDIDQLVDGLDGGGQPPRLSSRHSHSVVGGTFPQGPLLARALTEIDRGIEAASARRISHFRSAKALVVLWMALLAGGALAKSDGPLGFIARGAAGSVGGLLCAAASALFLAYWFSAKEEVQGLKEVFQTAMNYERHLPMEEAFPDTGFDTSQFHSYMEQNFRTNAFLIYLTNKATPYFVEAVVQDALDPGYSATCMDARIKNESFLPAERQTKKTKMSTVESEAGAMPGGDRSAAFVLVDTMQTTTYSLNDQRHLTKGNPEFRGAHPSASSRGNHGGGSASNNRYGPLEHTDEEEEEGEVPAASTRRSSDDSPRALRWVNTTIADAFLRPTSPPNCKSHRTLSANNAELDVGSGGTPANTSARKRSAPGPLQLTSPRSAQRQSLGARVSSTTKSDFADLADVFSSPQGVLGHEGGGTGGARAASVPPPRLRTVSTGGCGIGVESAKILDFAPAWDFAPGGGKVMIVLEAALMGVEAGMQGPRVYFADHPVLSEILSPTVLPCRVPRGPGIDGTGRVAIRVEVPCRGRQQGVPAVNTFEYRPLANTPSTPVPRDREPPCGSLSWCDIGGYEGAGAGKFTASGGVDDGSGSLVEGWQAAVERATLEARAARSLLTASRVMLARKGRFRRLARETSALLVIQKRFREWLKQRQGANVIGTAADATFANAAADAAAPACSRQTL